MTRPANMPILYINVMDGLRTERGRRAFLWATDKFADDRYAYRAEAFAHEVEKLAACLPPLIAKGAAGHAKEDRICDEADLLAFVLTRHANWRTSGNVRPDYAHGENP